MIVKFSFRYHFIKSMSQPTVDTIFWKNRSKEKQPMKIEYNRRIEEREGRSTRFVDSQGNSLMTVGQRVKMIGR
jgi:hypothetical protein